MIKKEEEKREISKDRENEELKKLLNIAIENDNNNCLLNETSNSIKDKKEKIIVELELNKKKEREIIKKLKGYRFIDDLSEIHIGTYIRWIKLDSSKDIKITNGAILVEILFDNESKLLLKNNMNRFFRVNFNDNLIFQKLTNQELVILYAIDNIDKIK